MGDSSFSKPITDRVDSHHISPRPQVLSKCIQAGRQNCRLQIHRTWPRH